MSAQCANRVPEKKTPASFHDRKSHAEAMTLSFLAENSLPLSLIPKLIKFAQEMARDDKALKSISMERQTGTYKLKEGLALVIHKKLINNLRQNKFSMNIDEATSNNNHKVFTILVSYFCENVKQVVIDQYESVTLTTGSSTAMYECIAELLERDDIPCENLISCLTDSANAMRGCNAGLQVLLRDRKVPHLIDIGGDVCHHFHNISKKFCGYFDHTVERLMDDLYRDHKFHQDLRVYLREICLILQIPYQTPRERAGHRWLSVLDVAQGNLAMFDAFTVLYAAWLPKDVKSSHMDAVNQLVASVSSAGQKRITEIRKACEKRVWSKDGRRRKQRIAEKIFMQRDLTLSLLHMYCSILPIFKSAILSFEQKVPMVHRIHDDIIDVTKKFLSVFLCPEKIADLSAPALKALNVHDEALQRPLGDIFIGKEAEKIISKWQQKVSTQTELMKTHMANVPVTQCEPENACSAFRKKVRKAYIETGAYLLGKLPLENKVLRLLSATDPRALGHPAAGKALRKLGAQFPTIALNQDAFTIECMQLAVDKKLPVWSKEQRLDSWWAAVFEDGHYPELSKLVKAALSIFTAPHVECAFSLMNNLITHKRARLDISTFSAYQAVQYNLKASNTITLEKFHREDIIYTPVDKSLAYHMQTAYGRHSAKQTAAQSRKKAVSAALEVQPVPKKAKSNVHELAKKIKTQMVKKRKGTTQGQRLAKRTRIS